MLTIIAPDKTSTVPGQAGSELWLEADSLESATGWTLKPEGLCRGDTCVPIPRGRETQFLDAGRINVSEFWQLLEQPIERSEDGDVWSLGEDAESRNEELRNLQAPDFTLPDFDGRLHSLHDFQRQKVLLITWASW